MSAAVAKKLLAASKAIGFVDKGGENAHFKFKFQAWDDVLPAVRDACAEVGLAILPSVELVEVTGDKSIIRLTLTYIDTETGETLTSNWVGEGKDNQDKGIQKACTSAVKYALLKSLMIPCADSTDPDGDGPPKASTPKTTKVAAQAPTGPSEKEKEAISKGEKALEGYRLVPGQIDQFKAACAQKGFKWYVQVLKAEAEGIADFAGLLEYVASKEPTATNGKAGAS